MKSLLTIFCISNTFLSVLAQDEYIGNRIIVKIKEDISNPFFFKTGKLNELNQKFNLLTLEPLLKEDSGGNKIYVLKFKDNYPSTELVNAYYKTNLFEYVEPDFKGFGFDHKIESLKPNDFYFKYQYHHLNDGSFNQVKNHPAIEGADIKSHLAWEVTQGNENVVLAIFDTGLKMDHREVKGRLWKNSNEKDNGIDDDGDGYIDDIHGWNFIDETNDPTDDQGHGTAVAGIAMANANNTFGIAGLDWNCKLMVLKVLGNDRGYYSSSLAKAIYYAVNNGAHVANMSLGGPNHSKTIEEAINFALNQGMLIVAAMGNDDNEELFYPAAYKNTLAVGATHPDDTRVSRKTEDWGSNFGDHIDVVAPGSAILGMSHKSDISYNSLFSGTSMASPLVAGLACLLKGQDMSRSPHVIAGIIRETSQDLVGEKDEDKIGWDKFYGYGRIDAFKAVNFIVKPHDEKISLHIFPNPVNKEEPTLTLPLFTDLSDVFDLTIINANGKIYDQIEINFTGLNVQLTLPKSMESGVYFFKFHNEKTTFTKKVVFQ